MPEAEIWLRGPVERVPDALVPAAHALLQARDDVERAATGLTAAQLVMRPGGAASAGFHLRHIAGSVERLLTYARGNQLNERQRVALAAEKEEGNEPASELITRAQASLDSAIAVLRGTSRESLNEPREVGTARLPSTVLGILYHVADHTQRHVGQLITTVKIVRGIS